MGASLSPGAVVHPRLAAGVVVGIVVMLAGMVVVVVVVVVVVMTLVMLVVILVVMLVVVLVVAGGGEGGDAGGGGSGLRGDATQLGPSLRSLSRLAGAVAGRGAEKVCFPTLAFRRCGDSQLSPQKRSSTGDPTPAHDPE